MEDPMSSNTMSSNTTTDHHRVTADNTSDYKSDNSDVHSVKSAENEKSSAPSPHIARGPSESFGARAEEKLEEITRVQSRALSQAEQDGEIVYPSPFKLLMISLALCLVIFCLALDNLIIATAIPRITDQFHAINDVGWYGSAYLLTTCAFQLFFGKLYMFFPIKWVYLIAIGLFELGSAVCGAAPNSDALIVGRAIAGLGAAGIFSGSILIVSYSVPLEKRPVYIGIIGGMYGIASVAGPLLGGVFTDHLTWRWCFYINLPLGAVTVLFILFFFTSPPKNKAAAELNWREKLALMDLEGTALFVPCVVCCLLALQWGGSKYAWSDGKIIALFVVFGVLLLAFIALQYYKGERATVPVRILKQRSVAGASLFIACLGSAFFALVYYVPIWFQAIKGASAVKSGIMNLPLVLSVTIFSIISGGATTATGYYTPWIIASSVLMAVGAGLISTFDVNTGHAKWIAYQFIFGAGVGSGIQNPMIVVQTVLDPADHPTGTAVIIFFQTFGGALFISVAQNVFTNKLLENLQTMVPQLDPSVVLASGATSLQQAVSSQYLPAVLKAYNGALDSAFYVGVAMSVASVAGALMIEWRSVKGEKKEVVAAEAIGAEPLAVDV